MGPDESRRLRPAYGMAEPVDQVIRLERFREAHPHVTIVHVRTSHAGYWLSDWAEGNGTIRRTVEYDLRLLLDQLDRAFSAAEGGEP